jgi:hypothetical protein
MSDNKNLSGMEQMMLRDVARILPSNEDIIQSCDLLRRDLARQAASADSKHKPRRPQ